jgi:excisionase family DNA binding protein
MKSELLTVDEAAELKGVSRSAIYTAVSEGRLPHTRVLRRIGLKRSDVEAWQPIAYAGRPGAKTRGGRPRGTQLSEETKAKQSAAARERWAERKQTSSQEASAA